MAIGGSQHRAQKLPTMAIGGSQHRAQKLPTMALRRSSRIRQHMESSPNVTTPARAPSSFSGQGAKITTRRVIRAIGSTSSSGVKKPQKTSLSKRRKGLKALQQVHPPPIKEFAFLKLPPEIRNMIYSSILSTGQLSILRTCREVNMEAQSMIYREGVCRRNAGNTPTYYNPSSRPKIQNFEVRCDIDSHGSHPTTMQTSRGIWPSTYWTFRPASSFGRADVRRNQMTIELDFGAGSSPSEDIGFILRLLDRPESFVGFRVLVVRFLNMPSRWSTADKGAIGSAVKNILEPSLGTAVDYEGNGNHGRCIVFHPWSNAGYQSHTLEPVWFMNRNDGQGRFEIMEEEDEEW